MRARAMTAAPRPPVDDPAAFRAWLLAQPGCTKEWIDAILTPSDVVEQYPRLAPSEGALANKRLRGTGPRYIKLGSKVLYRRLDIIRFLETRMVSTFADPLAHRQ